MAINVTDWEVKDSLNHLLEEKPQEWVRDQTKAKNNMEIIKNRKSTLGRSHQPQNG